MRIVFTDTTIHGALIGGAQLFLPGLMKGLIQKGHEVHLVVKDEPNEKVADFIKDSGATVHIKPWRKKGLVQDIAPAFAKWLHDLRTDIFVVSVSPDIGWVVLPYLDPSIATITIGHNDSETFYMPARHYRDFLSRSIGVSQEMCDYYISRCSISKDHVDWIPYGVQTSPSAPSKKISNEKLKLVYVGRVVEEQKRVSDLVAIVKQLSERNVPFKLTIVGDGPQAPDVRSALQAEIDRGDVEMTGWLTNPEIITILRQSHVFVLTSAYEGFCIALIEAIANGCCPVVTDIRSGNKEMVNDRVNGFIVDVGDIQKFADRITELANNHEKLDSLRLQAWENGKQYSTARMVELYEDCFRRAKADTAKAPRKQDPEYELMPSCRSKYPDWIRRLKLMVTAEK